jgi:hypothetical protein
MGWAGAVRQGNLLSAEQKPMDSAYFDHQHPSPKAVPMSDQTALPGTVFRHIPHPRIHERAAQRPPQTADERVGVNGKIGVFITTVVGTMWAAYLFSLLALVSLPAALASGDRIVIVAWIAQTFLQLVLLPVIIVGQNVQARAADKRAQQTYADAEAILHECLQLEAHLQAQDVILSDLAKRLNAA